MDTKAERLFLEVLRGETVKDYRPGMLLDAR